MSNIRKIVFITGTRADYGKIKSLMLETQKYFDMHVFVCGMHLIQQYGNTCREILCDGYQHVFCANDVLFTGKMDLDLANTIIALHSYIQQVKPDLIVVHGDRADALAGAISGMMNNTMIAHIEGGEVSGTVDEAIRHSISKMAQLHFVANFESKLRVIQLGEQSESTFVIGSPDIDIMLSDLPCVDEVRKKHDIPFDNYAICIYHPVTTETTNLEQYTHSLISALQRSGRDYLVIYPNNDSGSEIIIRQLETLKHNESFRLFRSLPFEDFLSLLKKSSFIVGNSSAGIREACVFGIPAIDIGSRQQGRYKLSLLKNIQHSVETEESIITCIDRVSEHKVASDYFGTGNSSKLFVDVLRSGKLGNVQKKFIDSSETQDALRTYINEVCF